MRSSNHSEDVPQQSVLLAIAVIVIIFNIAEIIIISTLNRRIKVYELLLLSLSVSDLLFGFSHGILCVLHLIDHNKYELFEIAYITSFYFVLTSILNLSWIALDRLWAICWPFSHKYNVTRRRIYILITATWIVTTSAALSLFFFADVIFNVDTKVKQTQSNYSTSVATKAKYTDNSNSTKSIKSRVQLLLSVFILLSYIIFGFCYGYIIYSVKQSKKLVKVVRDKVHANVSIVCILIATVFIALTLPLVLTRFIKGTVPTWAGLVLVANSAVNSVVYCTPNKCMKHVKRLKRTMGKRVKCKTPQKNAAKTSTVPGTHIVEYTSV